MSRGRKSFTEPEHVAAQIEQTWCWEQQVSGMTLRQIQAVFPERFNREVSLSTIHRRLVAEREEQVELRKGKREELAVIELAKMDRYLVGLHDLMLPTTIIEIEGVQVVVPQKPEVRIAATGKALELSRERRRMLGLDAPERSEVTVTTIDPTDIELSRLVAKMEKADKKRGKKKGRKATMPEVVSS